MTKYKIKLVEGKPCAVVDPEGCFYSTGEVDRIMEQSLGELRRQIYMMTMLGIPAPVGNTDDKPPLN